MIHMQFMINPAGNSWISLHINYISYAVHEKCVENMWGAA